MRPILLLSTIIVSVLFAEIAHGQQKRVEIPPILINDVQQFAVASHPATPFLEPSSIAIVEIDLTKIDVKKTAQWVLRQSDVAEDDEQAVQAIAMATGFVESLKGAGVSKIYVTAAPRSVLDGGPLVVIPCDNPAVVNGLASVLVQSAPKQHPQAVHIDEGLVLIGPQPAIDRVRNSEGTERPDLILPTKNAERLDHIVVAKLPDEARDDLIALWPDKTPETFPVQFSPRAMVRDIRRISISCSLPPEAAVVAKIETVATAAAERIRTTIDKLLAESPKTRDLVTVDINQTNVIVRATPDALAQVAKAISLPIKERSSHQETTVKMKNIGLAMHNYIGVNNHFPPRCLTDREAKPLLSWRVTILPYIEQMAMHRQFKLDEPWDSPTNVAFHRIVIPTYSTGGNEPWKTRIRVPVYPGSLWHGDGPPRTLRDVKDGTVNTIAAIHAPENAAIEWSNPKSWVLSEQDPVSDVFGDRDEVTVLMLDGSTRRFTKEELTNEKLKALLTIDGAETIEW